MGGLRLMNTSMTCRLITTGLIIGAFPPVIIDFEAENGQHFDELHVDGGATAQVFLFSSNLDQDADRCGSSQRKLRARRAKV